MDELETRSYRIDAPTFAQLGQIAAQDERDMSYILRQLIRQEYARRFSQPNPTITIAEAVKASE